MKRLLFIFALVSIAVPAWAETPVKEPVKVGEMMPYSAGANYAQPFREGWQMALDELNQEGGVHGHPIEVLSRDDKADPAEGVRLADELVKRDGAVILMGGLFNHVGLAVGAWANQYHIPFLKEYAGVCSKIEDPRNNYWFVNFPCMERYVSAYADIAAQQPIKRWAILAPNYEFGKTISATFIKALKQRRPDVVIVAEQYPTLGKMNAQEEIRALKKAKPEGLFNNLFERDLVQYLRQAKALDFCQTCFIMNGSGNIGSSIVMRELGDLYPQNWLVGGLPDELDNHPAKAFVQAYEKRFHKKPDLLTLDGYVTMKMVAEALRKAKSFSSEDITQALLVVSIEGPYGKQTMNPVTKQPEMGFWLGYTKRQDGKNLFVKSMWVKTDTLVKE